MPSQRRYTARLCQHPGCDALFVPTDRRQVYCTPQCRHNYNNDIKNETADRAREQKKLEQNDLILEYLYVHAQGNQFSISERMLRFKEVDLTVGNLRRVEGYKNLVHWYVHFGVVLLEDSDQEYFILSEKELLDSE